MTTTTTKVRALDVIAAEFREAVVAEKAARNALSDSQRSLSAVLDAAERRTAALREELNAAVMGRTVEEQQQRWLVGDL